MDNPIRKEERLLYVLHKREKLNDQWTHEKGVQPH